MLLSKCFSELRYATYTPHTSCNPPVKPVAWTAPDYGERVLTGEVSKSPEVSDQREPRRIEAWLDKLFMRCVKRHIERAEQGDFWVWP